MNPVPQSFRDHLEAENWKVGRSEIHELFASTDGTLKVPGICFHDSNSCSSENNEKLSKLRGQNNVDVR